MEILAPFGFVTGCHAGDKFMVQATLASMRHYCPNVPICLTVDGDCDVSDLERDYGIIVLRISELPSVEMRRTLGRSFHAKLAAMWEGPFEFYVWMDSDAIVWGDFTQQIRTDLDFQILWDGISIPPDVDLAVIPDWLPHYYFDPRKVFQHDPEFDWRGHAYFSAGVYATRRNAIDYDRYCQIKRVADEEPGTFAWGDMGMLNYLIHSQAQRGKVRIDVTNLQNIPVYNGWAEFQTDCAGNGWRFPEEIQRPRIGHFCGRKPFLFDRKAYSRPFTIARLEHHRRHHGELATWLAPLGEERGILSGKIEHRFKRLIFGRDNIKKTVSRQGERLPFGFVTGCHAGDKFMVQATLASMRHYCPNVPICLVVDGDFDVSDLERDYRVIPLRVSDLPSAEMRELVAGNPRAKLSAMWEGPFEHFVWLDSDAMVWGDFTTLVRRDVDFQIFWSEVSIPTDAVEVPEWLTHYYFDPRKLVEFDPGFKWQGLACFSTGVFACKRNAITFDEWMQLEALRKLDSKLFGTFFDMPLMNYWVHSKWQRGEMKVAVSDLQHIWGHQGKAELEQDCVGSGWHFPTTIRRPARGAFLWAQAIHS